MREVTITVNGQSFGGWETVEITRSLDAMADAFRLSYLEAAGFDTKRLPIYEDDECIIKVDGTPIIAGYVDDSNRSYDPESGQMEVSGRSYLGDVVDCAAIHKTGEWFNVKLLSIINDILAPFKRTASLASGVDVGGPIRKFAIQDGETAGDAIGRVCKMRGVLCTSADDGSIFLTRAGNVRSPTMLEYGRNILSGGYSGSSRERFSEYIVKAQAYGDDDFGGQSAVTIKRSVKDTSVKRYRPTVIMAENEDSGQELEQRAIWERNVRWGRAKTLEYTVQDWVDDYGALWRPNTIVKVDDAYLHIRDELLIKSVTFSRSLSAGTTSKLALVARAAYDVQPLPPKKPTRKELAAQ